MISPSSRRLKYAAVAIVLVVAAALRFWSLDFGHGVRQARPDEEFVAGRALEMVRTGDPNPHFFHYPTLWIYANALVLLVVEPLRDPDSARLAARSLSVLCAVVEVLVLVLLGARIFSFGGGIMAGGLLAVAYLHVRESHFGTPGIPMDLFVAAAVLAAERARLSGERRMMRFAGILAGLAAAVKYPGILALGPVAYSCAGAAWPRRERVREIAFAALLALACLAVTSPFLLLDRSGAGKGALRLFDETWGAAAPAERLPLLPLTFSLRYGVGVPALSLGLMGLAACARRREGRLLLVWFACFYVPAALTPLCFTRYALPLLPPLCLAAGAFVAMLPLRPLLKYAVYAIALVPPLQSSIAFDRLVAREDTRMQASRWIREHLSPGTKLMVGMGYGAPPVPKGYEVRPVDYRGLAVPDAERSGFRTIVMHDHPVLTKFSGIGEPLRSRLRQAERLASFSPFRPGGGHGLYDEFDAFYLPYAELDEVDRPGPVIGIWKLR